MKRYLISGVSVALLVSAVALPVFSQERGNTPLSPTTPQLGEKLQQLGNQAADAKTTEEVAASLSQLINDAATENRFMAVVGGLAKVDRDRIGELPRENYDELNKAIVQFRADFKARYHQDFAFKAELLKDADVTVAAAGATAAPAGAQGKNRVTVSLGDLDKHLVMPASGHAGAVPAAPDVGKDIPKTTGLPVVNGPTLTMVSESTPAPSWKADIPDQITGRQLKETLTRHLQKLADQKAAWADDPAIVYHAVATEVLQALADTSIAADQ